MFLCSAAAACLCAAPVAGLCAPESVVVQQGQSLSSIASQHGVSVKQLAQWNNLSSPDKVKVGQKISLRPPAGEVGSSSVALATEPGSSSKAALAPAAKNSGKTVAKKESAPAIPSMPVGVTAPAGVPDKVKAELASVADTLVNNAAKSIMPNVRSKAVAPGSGGGFVASYTEVEVATARAEVIPSSEKDKYVGSIRYLEHQYECPGGSKAEALQASCNKVKSRRMNELIRYEKGKWHY